MRNLGEIDDIDIELALGHSISEAQGNQIREAVKPYVQVCRRHMAQPPRSAAGRQKSFALATVRVRKILNNSASLDNVIKMIEKAVHTEHAGS